MTIIEIILALVALAALYVAYQARQDHNSFKVQAASDLATAKADLTADLHALELKFASHAATPAPVVPVAPAPPVPPAA